MVEGAGRVIFGVDPGGVAQELELVERQRLRARELAGRVGRGEVDLVAVVVAELEHRLADLEALAALDEPAPVGAAAELAVGHDREAALLLQRHHVADAAILDAAELRIVDLPAAWRRNASRSAAGRSRLPTWSARNGGRPFGRIGIDATLPARDPGSARQSLPRSL